MRHPLDTKSFVEWLRAQPKRLNYDYTSRTKCAICQYFNHVGIRFREVRPDRWIDQFGGRHRLPSGWDIVLARSPLTFGAAAKRAEKLLEHVE